MKDKVVFYSVYMGCDPEFFFVKNKEILGAEEVLPDNGITYRKDSDSEGDGDCTAKGKNSKIIIDGVQAELNPRPNTCRENLSSEISACFRRLHNSMTDKDKAISIDFSGVIKMKQKKLDSLSNKAKEFGCAPSKNNYLGGVESKIKVNPAKYLYRSAGGHIHLGATSSNMAVIKNALKQPDKLVPILDIILGNTCVLLDKNPLMKERRKNYGKAGEYRTPSYGIEYRTLSNFWLLSYTLTSLVMGLARFGVGIVATDLAKGTSFSKELLKLVKMKDIEKAINNNDFDLAYKNFSKIEQYIVNISNNNDPLSEKRMKEFHHFVKKGIKYWFPENALEHWLKVSTDTDRKGWERFCSNIVSRDMKIAEKIR